MPTVSMPIMSAQPVAPSPAEMASMTLIVVIGSASAPPKTAGAQSRYRPASARARTTSSET